VEEMSRRPSVTARRDAVARLVIEHGTISVAQLADILSVSVMTIHRDLNDLAAEGAIRRVRGGASAEPSAVFESSARFRLTRQAPAKGAIARAALTHIKPGMSLALSSSVRSALANTYTATDTHNHTHETYVHTHAHASHAHTTTNINKQAQ
jgi:DeoR/GlpR family transcriptional regulator of sugar metabolism